MDYRTGQFLATTQSIAHAVDTLKALKSGVDNNHAVTLDPQQCADVIGVIDVLRVQGEPGPSTAIVE